jgi:hypothetical protein
VTFWKWVSLDILALITKTSVYHVNLNDKDNSYHKIMDKAGPLVDS